MTCLLLASLWSVASAVHPGILVPEVAVTVRPEASELATEAAITATITLTVPESGAHALPLTSDAVAITSLTLDGEPVGAVRVGGQRAIVALWTAGTHEVELEARVSAQGTATEGLVDLLLPTAAKTAVVVRAPELETNVPNAILVDDTTHYSRPAKSQPLSPVTVTWAPERPERVRPQQWSADCQTTLTVDDVQVQGETWATVRVRSGTLSALTYTVPGGVDGVEVLSPEGARAEVSGSQLVVHLPEPRGNTFAVGLRYRSQSPSAEGRAAPVPRISGQQGTHDVALLQTDQAVVAPTLVGRGSAVPMSALDPAVPTRLPGAPVAAFRLPVDAAGLQWRRLETTPAEEPPLIVDHALYEVAFAGSGAGAVRATWQVRNDRAPFLRVQLPPGWRALSARVAGRSVVLSHEDDVLLIPLEKSTETLAGRVRLPVELSAVGTGPAWSRGDWTDVPAPVLDAPITRVEWLTTLPPELSAKRVEGARPMVSTHEVAVGRATATEQALQAVEDTKRRRASTQVWNQAYAAYKDNDFEEAERLIARSSQLNPDNVAAQQLASNLAVLSGKDSETDDDASVEAVKRRVKAMARAKSGADLARQQTLETEARAAEARGDTAEAARAYRALYETTTRLAKLEQTERQDQKGRLAELEAKVAELDAPAQQANLDGVFAPPPEPVAVFEEADEVSIDVEDTVQQGTFSIVGGSLPAAALGDGERANQVRGPATPATGEAASVVLDFAGEEIVGALTVPEGARLPAPAQEPQPAPPPPPPADDWDGAELEQLDFARDEVQMAEATVAGVQVARRVRGRVYRVVRAVDDWLHAPEPPRPAVPEAHPGLAPLPDGITAATGDVSLPIDPEGLLHVEQHLVAAGEAPTLRVRTGRR